jgi:predicted metal-dependent HD superfamily phosphohydrolase
MLQHFSSYLPQITNPTAVGLAIVFHDWEYLTHSPPGWSEEQSIVHFNVFAEELHLPSPLVGTIRKYITATISHKPPPEDEDDGDLKLFLDFDLEVLGRDRKDYVLYSKQIRKEYNQFDDQLFGWGRKAVLEKFLGRERLFLSDVFFERCEERARDNLNWEIGGLKCGGDWGIMGKLRGDGGVEK